MEGTKDANGAFLPAKKLPTISTVDLGDMLTKQLLALAWVTTSLADKAKTGLTKDEIQSLATCIKLTMELKSEQKELMDELDDSELEQIAGTPK